MPGTTSSRQRLEQLISPLSDQQRLLDHSVADQAVDDVADQAVDDEDNQTTANEAEDEVATDEVEADEVAAASTSNIRYFMLN